MRRSRVITAAAVTLAAIGCLSLAAIGAPGPDTNPDAPASTTRATEPAAAAGTVTLRLLDAGKPCEETDACFNPCTMGLDGTRPASDPAHWTPGPCDMDSTLPHGRRFVMEISPADPATVGDLRCAPDQREWLATWVRVWLRETDGSAVEDSAATATVCVRLVGGIPDLSAVTPGLFREAATHA